jgi:hypothetical protein
LASNELQFIYITKLFNKPQLIILLIEYMYFYYNLIY